MRQYMPRTASRVLDDRVVAVQDDTALAAAQSPSHTPRQANRKPRPDKAPAAVSLVAAGVALAGFLITLIWLPRRPS